MIVPLTNDFRQFCTVSEDEHNAYVKVKSYVPMFHDEDVSSAVWSILYDLITPLVGQNMGS